jgi:uncharacterized membrane protein YadS
MKPLIAGGARHGRVAAGRAISADAAYTAVITKTVRVMMWAPFLAILSTVLARTAASGNEEKPSGGRRSSHIVIP